MKKRLEQTGLCEEVVLIKKKKKQVGWESKTKGPEDHRKKNVRG